MIVFWDRSGIGERGSEFRKARKESGGGGGREREKNDRSERLSSFPFFSLDFVPSPLVLDSPREQIHVTTHEHERVELLRPEGDACGLCKRGGRD